MRLAMVMTAALLAAGCATTEGDEEQVPEHGATTGRCDAAKAQALVGRPATGELGTEALRLSGAGTLRWLRPGQVVTMEYRADRLNIELDAKNSVVAIRCG